MDEARIRRLLGGEFAQDDPDFEHYAVPREDILRSLSDTTRRLLIINAPRGSGKSGLLLKHATDVGLASKTSNIVIKKYLNDVRYPTVVDGIEGGIQHWTRQILIWIVTEIGARLDVARTDEQAIAIEFAERAGLRPKVKRVDAAATEDTPDSVLESIVAGSSYAFWLLLDEMDDLFDETVYKRDRLSALLYSAKAMLRLPNVFLRITIRPHILTILRTHYDHIQQLRANELEISWNSKQLKQVLARRIAFFDQRANGGEQLDLLDTMSIDTPSGASMIIARHFDDFDMSFAEGHSRKYQAFHTVSLGRPRWMLEFCALALRNSRNERATAVEYKKAMHLFGNNRVQFLAGEHKFHAPQLEEWINGLSSARTMKFATSSSLRMAIEKHILHIEPLSHRSPQDPLSEQSLKIARLLFMVEIIRAREGSNREYRFYRYSERPSLLASWTQAGRIGWEIHPTFGRALNIIDNQTFSVGGDVRVFGERVSDFDDDELSDDLRDPEDEPA